MFWGNGMTIKTRLTILAVFIPILVFVLSLILFIWKRDRDYLFVWLFSIFTWVVWGFLYGMEALV